MSGTGGGRPAGGALAGDALVDGLPVRDTARGLVLDPADRVLLIAYEAARDLDPARPGERAFWFTPGGGLESGETHVAALVRELEEEIGVVGAAIGPELGTCAGPFALFRTPRHRRDRFHLVRLPDDRVDTRRLAETESDPVLGTRWWTLEALAQAQRSGWPRIEPDGLAALARRVVAAGDEALDQLPGLSWGLGAA